MPSPNPKLIQAATCIISHRKFVQLKIHCLREQLGKHVISGGRFGLYVGGTILSLLLLLGTTSWKKMSNWLRS